MTANQCESCTAPATLTICTRCQTELRAQLHELAHGPKVNGHTTAGLLDACEDVVLRRTRLSTGGGHRKKGDEQPAPFLPDETRGVDELGDAIPARDKAGRLIESRQQRAARLLTSARNTLSTTIRDLCETRGVECPAILDAGDMALWLAGNIHAIACDESAGRVRAEVDTLVRSIERVVDKPVPMRLLGFCSTELDGNPCGEPLHARDDQIEVYCRKCRTTRPCDRVRMIAMADARRTRVTWEQVLLVNRQQPEGYRVADRTLREWRSSGTLKIRGYARACGTRGIHRRAEDDVPLYLWSDVERLRAAKPQKVATGAAARCVIS